MRAFIDRSISRSRSVADVPDVVLDSLPAPDGGSIRVAREDLLPGGTKQRAIVPYLRGLIAQGYREFAYASPFCGFAQVALAAAARSLGVKASVFCEPDPGVGGLHEYARLAMSWGARLEIADDLGSAEDAAFAHAANSEACYKIPLGFQDRAYMAFMAEALIRQTSLIEARSGSLRRVWVPVGSGTLARALATALPAGCEMLCVDVGVLEPNDARVAAVERLPGARLTRAPMPFAERARDLPPVPSNLHYDAKLWARIKEEGRDGDLWWNVAR